MTDGPARSHSPGMQPRATLLVLRSLCSLACYREADSFTERMSKLSCVHMRECDKSSYEEAFHGEMDEACEDVLARVRKSSELLDIAMKLEEIALKDEYFVSRKLYPNVDFYSGVIYQALDIPVNMFTAMFAMGRLPGWIAQWLEMRRDPSFRISRPRQIYTGPTQRPYVPIEKRA